MTWQDVLDPDKGFIKDDSITLEVSVILDFFNQRVIKNILFNLM